MVTSIGGPLRPDPSTCVRVDPGAYLRVASDALVCRLVAGGRAARPLCEAIQAAQMLDMFFPRDGVMGFADGCTTTRVTWITLTQGGAMSH